MIRICAFNISGNDTDILYDVMKQKIPKEKYIKTEHMKLRNDKYRTVFGYMMLGHMLKKHFCIDEYELMYNEYGKPYIRDHDNVYFNISHSGDWVVCTASNREIGIDIEYIRKMERADICGVLKHFATDSERDFVLSSCDDEIQHRFFDMWTAKESLVKCIGSGISEADKYNVRILPDGSLISYAGGKIYHIKNMDFFDRYSLSVCSEEKFSFPEIVIEQSGDFLYK